MPPSTPPLEASADVPRVSFREALRVWARIGLMSFGGPAAQIALMHKELVQERRWIDESRFLHALNYCMLLPGPEAQQLAVYIGWLMHKTRGGLAAGILFVLPGAVAVLSLSALYATWRHIAAIDALFFGLKCAVVAVVVEALLRVGKRALAHRVMHAFAAAAFVALFFFAVPFPSVIAVAGAIGWLGARHFPAAFATRTPAPGASPRPSLVDHMAARGELEHARPSRSRSLRVLALGAALWALPIGALAVAFGSTSVFVDEALFFSKAAVVTFGGAYSVLAYVAQRAVETYGWLRPGEMLDGLGLAETTPGPLILVVQFVGFLGAFREPSGLPPLAAGALGAAITLWVTFVPCFVWIFLGAPYMEALRSVRALQSALSAITASVVGVIANLSLWFALHVAFTRHDTLSVGPVRCLVPDLATLQVPAVVLSAGAMVAMLRFKLAMGWTLAACALLGAAWKLLAAA